MSTSPSRISCWDWLPLRPPHLDVRLDLVELLEGAVEVHGIDLVGRHAVGEQRVGDRARPVIEQAARAREFLDVPEIRPGPRAAVRKLVAAVAQVGAERAIGDAIGEHGVRRQHILLDDRPVDRLDIAFELGAQPIAGGNRGHVPFVAAALHLRLELGVGHRRHRLDANAGGRGERLEERIVLGRGPAAAPGVDVERARLGDAPLRDDQRAQPGDRGGGAGPGQEASAGRAGACCCRHDVPPRQKLAGDPLSPCSRVIGKFGARNPRLRPGRIRWRRYGRNPTHGCAVAAALSMGRRMPTASRGLRRFICSPLPVRSSRIVGRRLGQDLVRCHICQATGRRGALDQASMPGKTPLH